MGEFNGVVLSILLVVAIFAAMIPVMTSLYNGVISSVSEEVTDIFNDFGYEYDESGNLVKVTSSSGN